MKLTLHLRMGLVVDLAKGSECWADTSPLALFPSPGQRCRVPLWIPHWKIDVDSTDKMMWMTNLAHWSPPADGVSWPICSIYLFQELKGGLCKLLPSTGLICKGTFTWLVPGEWGLSFMWLHGQSITPQKALLPHPLRNKVFQVITQQNCFSGMRREQ